MRQMRYAAALLTAVLIAIGLSGARAQTPDEVEAPGAQAQQLFAEGKYAEALATQRTLVASIEKAETAEAGAPARKTAEALGTLAWYALFSREYAEALAASQGARTLAPEVLAIDANRAHALLFMGRTAEARKLYLVHKGKRLSDKFWENVIGEDFDALRAAGIVHDAFPEIVAAMRGELKAEDQEKLAALDRQIQQLYEAGKYGDAAESAQKALDVVERAVGPENSRFISYLQAIADLYTAAGRYGAAELFYKRALDVMVRRVGPQHAEVAILLKSLANIYAIQNRHAEAEPLATRAIEMALTTLGSADRWAAPWLRSLSSVFAHHGSYVGPESSVKRVLVIGEQLLGPEHIDLVPYLNSLARIYDSQSRFDEAEQLHKRSLEITERSEPRGLGTANVLANVARHYATRRDYDRAERFALQALETAELAHGPDNPSTTHFLQQLADVYSLQRRYAEALRLYVRALAGAEKAFGSEHLTVGVLLLDLSTLHYEQGDWQLAVEYGRRAAKIVAGRVARDGVEISERYAAKSYFIALVKAAHRLKAASATDASTRSAAAEMFEAAQWATTSAAAGSLQQMSARGAARDPKLAERIREQQDLLAELRLVEQAQVANIAQAWEKIDQRARAAYEARIPAIKASLAEISLRVAQEFPDYAAVSSVGPISTAEVQSQLRGDEALVFILEAPEWLQTSEETFVWVVTKTDLRWVRSELGTAALTREVAALRCGLDRAAWEQDRGSMCAGLLNIAADKKPKDNGPLPFDIARAGALYKALFGQVENLIAGKHLLIVPSGPLTQLPFHVLVTGPVKRPASATSLRSAAWLARKHAITVLPAVSSLKALRRVARPSAAIKPMIGFGNPLLDGDPVGRPSEVQLVKLSREKQACPPTLWERVAGLVDKRRSVERVPLRGGHADLEHLRFQVPLHETADELCAVARDLRLEPDDILLGARATETNVKQLSNDGKLNAYRVVHFATHGTVVGEIEGTTEPGLILTPPDTATDLDDGYLSASEVASLKLDADWVVLSACNTAAGSARDAEALSGLARAFIYAGARSLLVSHWAVPSAATAKLVSTAVGATARDKRLGRAESLRRAMLAMIDKGERHEAHPSYWAPFIVVGEGAAAQ